MYNDMVLLYITSNKLHNKTFTERNTLKFNP